MLLLKCFSLAEQFFSFWYWKWGGKAIKTPCISKIIANLEKWQMMQAAEVESQVRLLEHRLSNNEERSRQPASGFVDQQAEHWDPFQPVSLAPRVNGGPGLVNLAREELLLGESSTESNHSCGKARSKQLCSPPLEGAEVPKEENGKSNSNNGSRRLGGDDVLSNGWAAHTMTNLPNNGGQTASDHWQSLNRGNILMVSPCFVIDWLDLGTKIKSYQFWIRNQVFCVCSVSKLSCNRCLVCHRHSHWFKYRSLTINLVLSSIILAQKG